MNQEVITRILGIERQAVQIRDEAQQEAKRLIEETERAAAAAQEEALGQARREAEQIVAGGRAAAEQTRSDEVAQAQAQAERVAATMAQHVDLAVQYVLKQVTGQG